MLKLYFLRHGQTDASRENMFSGSGTDISLTSDGEQMAESFAEFYKDVKWETIYCSPLNRTVTTAHIIAAPIGATVNTREGLVEIGYGAWEGKTVAEVEQFYHDDHIAWTADPAWYPPTDGESAIAVATRALNVITEIRSQYEDGKVLIVAHKATIRIALCGLLGIDVGRFRYRLACPVG